MYPWYYVRRFFAITFFSRDFQVLIAKNKPYSYFTIPFLINIMSFMTIFTLCQDVFQNICFYSSLQSWMDFTMTCKSAYQLFDTVTHDTNKISKLLSYALLDKDNVEKFTSRFANKETLEAHYLRFSYWHNTFKITFINLQSTCRLSLQTIILHKMRLKTEVINSLFTTIPNFKELQITHSLLINGFDITQINFPQALERIIVYNTPITPLTWISEIFCKCQSLKYLSISLPKRITYPNLEMWKPTQGLEELHLKRFSIDSSSISTIFKNFTSLKALSITDMKFFSVGSFEVQREMPIFSTLQSVNFSETDISAKQLSCLFAAGKRLTTCKLNECKQLSKQDFESLNWPITLKNLSLKNSSIDFAGVNHLTKCAPLLLSLRIDKCYAFRKSTSLKERISLWLPKNLKSLSLKGLAITNRVLSHIVQKCKELEMLNIDYCHRLSDAGLYRCTFPKTLRLLIVPAHISLKTKKDLVGRNALLFKVSGGCC